MIIWLANRNGGKTMQFAVLSVLDSEANDHCESANFGAIKRQALKCYSYIKQFLQGDKDLLDSLSGDITMGGTRFQNQSSIEVLVATIAGVNSPHPNKLKADEVELISWFILQEALSMPTSRGDVNAVTVLGSTRKFAHGPMQRLIDENQAKVFQWCIWEVMEKWPDDIEMQNTIKETIIKKYGDLDILPTNLDRLNGYYKWRDLLTKIRTLDKETFMSQWMCKKPDSGGLIYPKFDEILNNNPNFILDTTGRYPIQVWEDFGYAKPDHPDAIGLVQLDVQKMEFTIFDELWIFESGTQDIVMDVVQMLQRNGLVDTELLDVSREQLQNWIPSGSRQINYAQFFTKLNLWIPDYHGLTEIADRRRFGCPIPEPSKVTHEMLHGDCQDPNCSMRDIAKLYLKENGIPHVRNFIDDRRMKMVMEKTPNSRNDFLSYSKKRNGDGTWSDQPEKMNDHAPDYVHYGSVYNFPNLAYQSFDGDTGSDTVVTNIGGENITVPHTFTGGIMKKTF